MRDTEVPYDAWIRAWTGGSLNEAMGWERNHFDRLTHFLYGLLMAYPIREIFLRIAGARGFWGYFQPLDFTLSTSASSSSGARPRCSGASSARPTWAPRWQDSLRIKSGAPLGEDEIARLWRARQ